MKIFPTLGLSSINNIIVNSKIINIVNSKYRRTVVFDLYIKHITVNKTNIIDSKVSLDSVFNIIISEKILTISGNIFLSFLN